jgi:hypothetical protein
MGLPPWKRCGGGDREGARPLYGRLLAFDRLLDRGYNHKKSEKAYTLPWTILTLSKTLLALAEYGLAPFCS